MKKNNVEPVKKPEKKIRIGFTIISPYGDPVPVAKPAPYVQVAPIIQPVVSFPFSGLSVDKDDDEFDD